VNLRSEDIDRGKRLDVYVHEKLTDFSRARIQEWIKAGRVLVDGLARKSSYELHGGESIEVQPAAQTPLSAAAEDLPIDILYEDEDVIAVNKPAGVVVHAGAGVHSGTLVNRLVHHFSKLSTVGGELRPGIVHRLDKDTSGVLLVARTDAAHRALAGQFAGRRVEKIYLALVHGAMKQDRGTINTKITRDPVRRTRMTARLGEGRIAITDWEVLQRWPAFTLLRVRIGTGRTHQIRVHLASIGHPVAGDKLYGATGPAPGRFFLHAHRISFTSPSTGERITVESPLPVELSNWMQGL
jgi:23S rRNA pseudouridine1911/1915/1917 synthase